MSTNSCTTTLAKDILNDCNEPHGKGVEKTFYFISRSAIDFGTAKRKGHTVTDFTVLEGKRGYKVRNPFSGVPQITVTDKNTDGEPEFDKVLPIRLLADSPDNAEAIMGLKTDKYVCIYENMEKGVNGEQAFVIFGWETGASGVDMNLEKAGDNGGGWAGNLTELGAATSQIFFFKESYAVTKQALESMCTAI